MSIAVVLVRLLAMQYCGLALMVPTWGRALGSFGVEAKLLALTMR